MRPEPPTRDPDGPSEGDRRLVIDRRGAFDWLVTPEVLYAGEWHPHTAYQRSFRWLAVLRAKQEHYKQLRLIEEREYVYEPEVVPLEEAYAIDPFVSDFLLRVFVLLIAGALVFLLTATDMMGGL